MIKKFRDSRVKKIKNHILGEKYDLSVRLVDEKFSKSLNFRYRKIKKATDILSFAISDKMGEIFICPEAAKIKSKKFGMTYREYLLFLVIHGSLHLKGLKHGGRMTEYELTYYSWYRRRHL